LQDEKERLGLVFENDGEFYMSQKDFIRNFDHLEICNLTPDTLDDEQLIQGKLTWHESTFNGSWIAGETLYIFPPKLTSIFFDMTLEDILKSLKIFEVQSRA
jgi:calpain